MGFIAISLILGAVVFMLSKLWRKIVDWLKKAAEAVQKAVNAVVEGVRTFLVRMSDGLKKIARHYLQNKITKEYEETDVITNISESEVPEELKAKISAAMNVEVETTNEVEATLESAV